MVVGIVGTIWEPGAARGRATRAPSTWSSWGQTVSARPTWTRARTRRTSSTTGTWLRSRPSSCHPRHIAIVFYVFIVSKRVPRWLLLRRTSYSWTMDYGHKDEMMLAICYRFLVSACKLHDNLKPQLLLISSETGVNSRIRSCKSTYLNELDVRKTLVVYISPKKKAKSWDPTTWYRIWQFQTSA